ncbi:WavE lipopolysaccharide synthesis family protein [Aeromonas allosaccharophila]|uniref:WavE lipopolysaccharide synthesis family protein n=1 Tax=Aeromonas allosaccharophila TaxID=656 RepID=A0AAX3NX17_9GAMM|nr:WavE lipopolysaccharide synthesis family protein [Aeromonas allosaccharophila]WED78055.1 WavE lipopolysaccharide synthesis family protein [Aeromonas allosaccharophila]
MSKIKMISVVICGVRYNEFDLKYSVLKLREVISNVEVVLSTNDITLFNQYNGKMLFDKVVFVEDHGALPSLKFCNEKQSNNINRMISVALAGIQAANHNIIIRLRTDQILTHGRIVDFIDLVLKADVIENERLCGARSKIITSSLFSINPRYSERFPYHVGDMFQIGYKEDLIRYFSAPEFPFDYAVWYETRKHLPHSNFYEKQFRARYAVEQWLTLHYIFGSEDNFPIRVHNDCDSGIIEVMEKLIFQYFYIASPEDLGLRASKFEGSRLYYTTQCYSTKNSESYLRNGYIESKNAKGVSILYRLRDVNILSSIWRFLPAKIRIILKDKLFGR